MRCKTDKAFYCRCLGYPNTSPCQNIAREYPPAIAEGTNRRSCDTESSPDVDRSMGDRGTILRIPNTERGIGRALLETRSFETRAIDTIFLSTTIACSVSLSIA